MEGEWVTVKALADELGLGPDAIRTFAKRRGIPYAIVPSQHAPGYVGVFTQADTARFRIEHAQRQYSDSPKALPGKGYIDMTGQKINRFTFVEYRGRNDAGQALWLCRCDCGTEKTLTAIRVRHGSVKSCGCLRRETTARVWVGREQEIIERAREMGRHNKGHRNFSETRRNWRCATCDCDFGMALAKDRKFRTDRQFCSTECWYEFIRSHPDQHPSWRGGHHPYYGPIWDRQAAVTRSRDKDTCQHCGKHQTKPRLQVHHIKPLRDYATWEAANILDNLITLCKRCHKLTEVQLDKARPPEAQVQVAGG